MSTPEQTSTLIVGSGIGGVALALALAQAGHATHVLEQAPELGEIGAGIQLAPNALRALDRLGVLDSVYENGVFPPRAVMADARTGAEISHIPFADGFEKAYGYPYVVTHRSDLHSSLLAACRASGLVTFETGRRVTSVVSDHDSVRVSTAEGEEYVAPSLVGADGLHSVVRQYVVGRDRLVRFPDVAYRGTVPYRDIPQVDGKDDMRWWVGPGMHLIQYPVRRRELFNQVAVITSDRYSEVDDDWGTPEELDERFSDKHEHVRRSVSLVGRDKRWVLADREPVANWTCGRTTLMGDAAHPMLQNLAQGGCQALEDALVLSEAIALHPNDPETAFKRYQDARISRTAKVQTWARYMRNIAHADGLLAILRNALLEKRSANDLTYFDWLYGYESQLS